MPQQRTENEVPEVQRTHYIYWHDLLRELIYEHLNSDAQAGLLRPPSAINKEPQSLFGHHKGPLHIHHWIIACKRDAQNHVFYKHLKALSPVNFIWHHLHLGLRRFRAFAFVVKGKRKETSQLFRKGWLWCWCCVSEPGLMKLRLCWDFTPF